MKKLLISLAVMLLAAVLSAQSADEITKILLEEQATYGEVCYLVALNNGLVPDSSSETDALNAMFEQGQLISNVTPDTKINYEQTAFYLCKMWKIKGSLLFRLSKGSAHYAYRQLKKDGVLPEAADPTKIPSGTDILNCYTYGQLTYVAELGAIE